MEEVHIVLEKRKTGITQILHCFEDIERAYDTAKRYRRHKEYDNVEVQSVTIEKGRIRLYWEPDDEKE